VFPPRPIASLAAALLLFAHAPSSAGEPVADKVDWPAFMARHDMVWERLPSRWTEAPHFGNATLGSMLFRSGDALTMQVFRAGLCDRRDNSHGWTAYSRPRFTIGSFKLKPAGKIVGGTLRKDLWNAELTGTLRTDRGTIRLRHWVHADEMAIVTEIWASPGETGCQWEWVPHKAETTRPGYPKTPEEIPAFAKKYGDVYLQGLKLGEPNPDGRLETDGPVNVWVQDLRVGGQYAIAWADDDRGAGHRVHVANIADDFPQTTARDTATKTVAAWRGRDTGPATETHRAWWHRYYRASFVTLPDTRLETLYWNTIYRLGATARTGRFIVDTPGIWSQGGGWCYITTDYNIQAALWPVYAANRLEVGGELIEMLHRGRENLARNVRPAEWQADSAYLSIATQADMVAPRDQDMRYWDLVGCLPWALHNCWWQYRYSMDDAKLREKLFPLLRRAVNLYLHMLREEEGGLRLPPTYSPEAGTFEDCNFDLALLRWGCETLLWSARRLGIDDPLIPKWNDVLARLVDFPADENGFRLGSDKPASTDHRHGSHLMMIYPLHLVNIDQPGSREVLRRSVERFAATRGLPAMVATHAAPAAAAIGDGDLALEILQKQAADLYPNGMWYPSPCLESSLSAANNIQSMLLQSWGGKIRLFPAAPAAWPDALFHNLRAEGAFLVSARRAGGKTRWVRIESLAGEPCLVKPGFDGEPRVANGAQRAAIKPLGDGVYEVALAKGESVVLSPGNDPHPVVEALPAQADRLNSFGLRGEAPKPPAP
jgi:hypothetical protein